jgi:hypothetical protein
MNGTARLIVAIVAALVPVGPQRDAPAPTVDGRSAITGVVVTDEPVPKPVRRATVTISGPLPASRSAITDDDGRFLFEGLVTGRFKISATKAAFLPAALGATRPGRPGTAVPLGRDERLQVTLRMTRGAVIAGTIRDDTGAPIAGVQVRAVQQRAALDSAGADAAATSQTDDRGGYRLFGLPPGDFVIQVTPKAVGSGAIGARSTADMDALVAALTERRRLNPAPDRAPAKIPPARAVSLAPVYFPGTPLVQEAAVVTLAPADERDGVDVTVGAVSSLSVEGVVSGPVPDLGKVEFSIIVAGQRSFSSFDANPVLAARPAGSDGRFKYENLAPGHYTILARANPGGSVASTSPSGVPAGPAAAATGAEYLYASADVDARGNDLTGISLVLQPGGVLAGRLVIDPMSSGTPPKMTDVRISVSPGSSGYLMTNGTLIGNPFRVTAPATIAPDGSFAIRALAPGSYAVHATIPGSGAETWWLRSAIVDGRDLLDAPFVVTPAQNTGAAVLTLSNRHTEISGALVTAAGAPAPEYTVVVFPADRGLWATGARRVQSVRPSGDGRYSIKNLPGGDYLVAAVTDLDPLDLNDATFLDQLVNGAIRVRLADGETSTQDLRLSGR